MNPRIRELWDQAAKIQQQTQDPNSGSWENQVEFVSQFAELIVRECAELMYGRDENGNCKDGDVIKKHFGVEE